MGEDAGVDGAGQFAFKTADEAHDADGDADVPLAVEEAKEGGNDEGGDEKWTDFANFTEEPAAEDDFLGNWGDDDEGDEGDGAVEASLKVIESDILGLGGVDKVEIL